MTLTWKHLQRRTKIDKKKQTNWTQNRHGTQNRHEHYQNEQIQKTEQHFYDMVQNRTQVHTSKLPKEKINENIQSTTDKYPLFIPVTEKSEEHKTM